MVSAPPMAADVTMMARAPPKKVAKRPVKKVVKKVVKKPVKKVAPKKPVKKVAPKKSVKKVAPKKAVVPGRRGANVGAQRGSGRASIYINEAKKIGAFGADAALNYGGGNGKVLVSPTFLAAAAVWAFILLRFVLFYGAFGDADL